MKEEDFENDLSCSFTSTACSDFNNRESRLLLI